MAVYLSPVFGVAGQVFDNNGNPLAGGKIYTYLAGTTTPAATYTTSAGSIAHTNPIVLDGAGRVPSGEIWLTDGIVYKFVVEDANSVLIGTYDNLTGINSNFVAFTNEQEIQTATAGQTVFNLATVTYQPGTNSLSVFVDGVNQYGPGAQYAYVETDADTVTFVSGLHVGASVKFTTSQLNTSGAVDASQVTYTPPFPNSVTTNVEDKLAQIISVIDFGADPTGATDSTTEIQNAIDALPSSGGALYFPTGTYSVSSAIIVNKPGLYYGDGWATNIRTTSATANIFTVTGAEQIQIQQIKFTSSVTRSGGWYVDVAASANRFRISDFAMEGAIGGVRTLATATSTIERGQILNCVASTGIPIRIDSGFDVTVRDIIADQAAQTFAGIYITNAGDITLEDLQLIRCGQALYVKSDSGNAVASLWANNCFFDNSTRGAYLQASGGVIVRSLFDQCWFSSSTNEGLRLEASGGGYIEGTDIHDSHFFLNGTYGVHISTANITNTQIHDCAMAQNTLAGVYVAANVNEFSIQDSRIGDTHGLSGNGDGIYIAGGTSNFYQVLNNNLSGNITSNLTNLASGTDSFIGGNIGVETGAWKSYTPTITASSGTITSTSNVAGRYLITNKTLFLQVTATIVNNGTGAGAVVISLPATILANFNAVLAGRENVITGKMLQGIVLGASGTINVTNYDNTYPGGAGHQINLTGTIEVQ